MGYSCPELSFGRKLRVPIDIFFGSNKLSEFYAAEELLKYLCQIFKITQKKINLKKSTSKSYFYQRRNYQC